MTSDCDTREPLAVIPIALKRVRGKTTYFVGSFPSSLIASITRTLVIETHPDGYQRPPSKARIVNFGNFLMGTDKEFSHAGQDAVIPPVLLNARGAWTFVPSQHSQHIGQLHVFEPAHVIDGQHRLNGFAHKLQRTFEPDDVDFIAYEDLPMSEEKRHFHIVNDRQKGVPKSIHAYNIRDTDDYAWLACQLDFLPDSPFHERIAIDGHLTDDHIFNLASVKKNVQRAFSNPRLIHLPRETKLEILLTYWSIIAQEYPSPFEDIDKPSTQRKYKLLELTGLIAWSLFAADPLLPKAYDVDTSAVDWEKVRLFVQQCGAIDWSKKGHFEGLTGEVGGKKIHTSMKTRAQTAQ